MTRRACLGILHRSAERGKPLPPQLKTALELQAGLRQAPPSEGLRPPLAFHINQREETIDLGETAGALIATSNMQMQTFVTRGLTAGFSAGAGKTAGSIGYQEEVAPTLKGTASGSMMPSVLCLNDQGGSRIDCSEDTAGTLRAQEHGHQPLVFENHGIDARYTGPYDVTPTISARAGTGGNNLPLVSIFSRQRVDNFKGNDVASTQSARQYKDATDLVLREGSAPACLLIRRLTPLECERLQGYPDGWTNLSGASDSARYRALGNSVAIPCVEYIMRGIVLAAETP